MPSHLQPRTPKMHPKPLKKRRLLNKKDLVFKDINPIKKPQKSTSPIPKINKVVTEIIQSLAATHSEDTPKPQKENEVTLRRSPRKRVKRLHLEDWADIHYNSL